MFSYIFKKIFSSSNEREIKAISPLIYEISRRESKLKGLSDIELSSKTQQLKLRHSNGESLDNLLPDAFALVREASVRTLGMRHYDVQMIGGVVLHRGRIAEMKTGEGKTLCATLPVYLNAISGKGVHVVTVNDYLAKRDAEWMGRIYSFLGMSVGVVTVGDDYSKRKDAYACDITYGQNNEFGFDYLRDNMKLELDEIVQSRHNFAIVDEVDSILIDEARTPLIISGSSRESFEDYQEADKVVRKLSAEEHYTEDLKGRQVMLTDEGAKKVEDLLSLDNLYDPTNITKVHHINQALKAHVAMKCDVDYVVKDSQIIIVDEFTGRLMPGRRWSDGLHQAIEAKERVPIAAESRTLATITFQNFFRMYSKLAGMTGTADTEAAEFRKIYNLSVVIIPTNMPMIRKDYPDVVYLNKAGKLNAIRNEIARLHRYGQPVLVGTANIEQSEIISEMLRKDTIPHNVLNAKHHEKEAEIIAQAGRIGAVTISTNMAGRGTDILLGGNPEFLAAMEAGTRDIENQEYSEALERYRIACKEERAKVIELGGLHILGTERHESRRIDNQLRGRSGRQGDPGSSKFYISFEDDLMRRFGGERMQSIMSTVGLKDDEPIAANIVSRSIENAQKKVEAMHFDTRKHLLEYDDVMNKHRDVIYSLRYKVLKVVVVTTEIEEMIGDVVEYLILNRIDDKQTTVSNDIIPLILGELNPIFGTSISEEELSFNQQCGPAEAAQFLYDKLHNLVMLRRQQRLEHWSPTLIGRFDRHIYLESIDSHWREHLVAMDHLKEGIGLRGYNQKNPLHEYQREALGIFSDMLLSVKISVLQKSYNHQLPTQEEIAEFERKAIEMQHKREAQARAVHADSSHSEEAKPIRKKDREESTQPRKDEAKEREHAYLEKMKKEEARKKNKEAKKARKKNR